MLNSFVPFLLAGNTNIKITLKKIPCLPGIYQYLDKDGNSIYVGKAKNLRKRISSYFHKGSFGPRITRMLEKVEKVEITVTSSETEALILENNLIKKLHPRYNILFRDDKSYPYILFSKEKWPRISYYRGKMDRSNSCSFGPYPNSWAVKETLLVLQKIFQLRTCGDSVFSNRSRPCILNQIGRCSAPCVGLITSEKYQNNVQNAIQFLGGKTREILKKTELLMRDAAKELRFEDAANFRNQMHALSKVLEKQSMEISDSTNADIIFLATGCERTSISLGIVRKGIYLGNKSIFPTHIEKNTPQTILEAFLSNHYISVNSFIPDLIICSHEFPARKLISLLSKHAGRKSPPRFITKPKGIYHAWFEQTKNNAKLSLKQVEDKLINNAAATIELAKCLKLNIQKAILGNLRIECFDISHIAGEATKASCVVFKHNDMQRALYRHYNIVGISPGDDYSAMYQVFLRRFSKKSQLEFPDLILIDGGKGQVSVAKQALNKLGIKSERFIIGIAKDKSRKPGLEKLVFCGHQAPILSSKVLMLILSIRDEAHRFAISHMRLKQSKKYSVSRLEEIEGIGMFRRRNLLNKFGGFSGVVSASVEELISVQGISNSLAQRIYKHLHD